MTTIIDTVTNLISLLHEYEWLDFKENWFSKDEIGEYISLVTIPFNKIDAAPFELNAGEEGNIQKNEKSDQKLHPNCTLTAPETENLHCNCTVNVPEIALKTFMALIFDFTKKFSDSYFSVFASSLPILTASMLKSSVPFGAA